MSIIMKSNPSGEAIGKIKELIESKGLQTHISKGAEVTVTETYKLVNKKFHPEDSLIKIGNTYIGSGRLTIMAGPCAIENHDMILRTAGSDGLIVEVHPYPSRALSDGPQSLTFEQFHRLADGLKPYAALAGREF